MCVPGQKLTFRPGSNLLGPASTQSPSLGSWSGREARGRQGGTGRWARGCNGPCSAWPLLPRRLHARFYELAPNLVPMDYRKSPIVHVPMSLIIQMPELRVGERQLGRAGPQRLQPSRCTAPRGSLHLTAPQFPRLSYIRVPASVQASWPLPPLGPQLRG